MTHRRALLLAALTLVTPLGMAGAQAGTAAAPATLTLRGRSLATFVTVEAMDGYRVLFSIAELDSRFTDRVVIVADAKDGRPLPAGRGSVPSHRARREAAVALGASGGSHLVRTRALS